MEINKLQYPSLEFLEGIGTAPNGFGKVFSNSKPHQTHVSILVGICFLGEHVAYRKDWYKNTQKKLIL